MAVCGPVTLAESVPIESAAATNLLSVETARDERKRVTLAESVPIESAAATNLLSVGTARDERKRERRERERDRERERERGERERESNPSGTMPDCLCTHDDVFTGTVITLNAWREAIFLIWLL